jgi:hypothetical protein
VKRLAFVVALLFAGHVLAEPPKVVLFPDGGYCVNAGAAKEAAAERQTCAVELTDARKAQAVPVIAAAGVGAVLAIVATVIALGASGHLR